MFVGMVSSQVESHFSFIEFIVIGIDGRPESWSGWNSAEWNGNGLEIPYRLLVHRMGMGIVIDISNHELD